MDLRAELARQSLLLEFISECVSLSSVPDLAKLVTSRLHWICDYETSVALLPENGQQSLWSQDRRTASAGRLQDGTSLAGHRSLLDDAMQKGSPALSGSGQAGIFLVALPLGANDVTHGALCLGRTSSSFSHGDIRHLQHACNAVGGALTRIAATTAERQAEHAIKLAEAALRAAAEDRALLAEQMVGIVSHDLRNPLSAILMGTTIMGKGEPLPVQKERVLQKVRNATQRAQRLVDELLDFTQARVGRGLALKVQEIDLDEFIASVVDEFHLSFTGVELRHPGTVLGTACLDPDRIHQLLGNLVANAVAYGAKGRTVRLACEASDEQVVLTVRNEGIPIPQEMLASMFEPMVRGTGHGQEDRSVGLGLYIVRAIAESHKGTVDVSSTPEEGTTFAVRLPRDSRLAAAQPERLPQPL